jgi:hypothetical protein
LRRQCRWLALLMMMASLTLMLSVHPRLAAATTVSPPDIYPDGGTYDNFLDVIIDNIPSRDTAYYTTDGSDPRNINSGKSFAYGIPFIVNNSETVEAAVYDQAAGWSDVNSAVFTIISATPPSAPSISPDGGIFTTAQSVTLSNIPNDDTAFYTTDGSDPTSSSTAVIYTWTFTVSKSEIIKAAVHDPVVGWSGISLAVFTIGSSTAHPPAPTISPDGGAFTTAQSVTIGNIPNNGNAYYTTDGSDPASSSAAIIYSGPFTVSQSETIRAVVHDPAAGWSNTVSAVFTVKNVPQNASALPFSDIPSGYWAYDAIDNLYTKGLASGYPDNTFRPDEDITRAEFVAMLVRALNLSTVQPDLPMLTDVAAGDWYYGPVETAVKANLVKGYANNEFLPNVPITRQEIAAILAQASGKADDAVANASVNTAFTDDSRIAGWARGFVAETVKDGLLKGYPDGSFGPMSNATRAEACAMISNFLKLNK